MGERQPPGQNRAWIGGGCIGLHRNKGILFEFSPVIDSFLKSLMFSKVSSIMANLWKRMNLKMYPFSHEFSVLGQFR
jgi:hypothetical protein